MVSELHCVRISGKYALVMFCGSSYLSRSAGMVTAKTGCTLDPVVFCHEQPFDANVYGYSVIDAQHKDTQNMTTQTCRVLWVISEVN